MRINSKAFFLCSLILPTTAYSALLERLGGLAYYDNESNLTWLANANASGASMNWVDANAWAASLTVDGITNWRLPNTVDVGNDGVTYTNYYNGVDAGYNITVESEMSNLFYNVLGNSAYYDINGAATGCNSLPSYCLINAGPFTNIQPSTYWSATEYAVGSRDAWFFGFNYGVQNHYYKTSGTSYAWAVYDGDVSAVPVPGAIWLFSSGLICIASLARRKCTVV